FAEATDLDAAIRSAALELIEGLDAGRVRVEAPPPPAQGIGREGVREMLERVARWDAAAWFRHREAYLATYGPLPFLPPTSPRPSCPRPIVLQATLGQIDGRAFGGADPDEPYVRTVAEFVEHVRAVGSLLGLRACQARGLVVCGGDFLRRDADEVAPYLEAA